ncbi:MAG TPA: TMEM175 family protein [Hanamia sp.]|nr:TMEM175 family protein [Hanamia sp.]
MSKGRLEAFSDGVFAILITIMVLELHPPEGASFAALKPVLPKFISYILSFTYVAIYWNNHHDTFQAVKHVNGRVLWCNTLLLFFISLIPFVTGRKSFQRVPCGLVWHGIIAGCFILSASFAFAYKTSWKRFFIVNINWQRF